MGEHDRSDFEGLNAEAVAAWDANSAFWDEHMGEGNDFHRVLIEPLTLALLGDVAGQRILEVACGNGQLARKLASLGARVLATDASAGQIARARAHGEPPEYRHLDAASIGALDGPYDAVVCSMALMDMAVIEPLAASLPRLLAPGGRFVFTVCHPVFNTMGVRRSIEEAEDHEGRLSRRKTVTVTTYATPHSARGEAVMGQPEPHRYFHRSLSDLLRPFLAHGLALDALEEPGFREIRPEVHPMRWQSGWPEIPPVLGARLRRP